MATASFNHSPLHNCLHRQVAQVLSHLHRQLTRLRHRALRHNKRKLLPRLKQTQHKLPQLQLDEHDPLDQQLLLDPDQCNYQARHPQPNVTTTNHNHRNDQTNSHDSSHQLLLLHYQHHQLVTNGPVRTQT